MAIEIVLHALTCSDLQEAFKRRTFIAKLYKKEMRELLSDNNFAIISL